MYIQRTASLVEEPVMCLYIRRIADILLRLEYDQHRRRRGRYQWRIHGEQRIEWPYFPLSGNLAAKMREFFNH